MEDLDLVKIARERDLYLRLLVLGREGQIHPLLQEALSLVVEVTGALRGYIELRDHDDGAGDDEPKRWWIARGLSDEQIEGVRAAISQGIVAETIATGQTVRTPSALLDPRFSERESVRIGRIEAVLCTPIGSDPPRGVLYLQGRPQAGPFSDEDRSRVEVFAYHLAPMVDRVLAEQRRRVATDPTQPLRQKFRLNGVIGRSPALAATLQQVVLIAPLDIIVLLTGESGTGKSQLARVIHDNSPRANQPFVEVNCATLPDTLIESELFGALPGAHSTATRRIDGKVAAAEGGTLFLDDVGDLPLGAQGKLLQLLQSREYYPLGASNAVQADVRLIAATNIDLKRAVTERSFREDLFYRLNVLPVRMPALAERRHDIEELAEFFCAEAVRHHRLPSLELSRAAVRALESAEWPGHIRQLSHAVQAAVIRAAGSGASRVDREHLFPDSEAVPEDNGRHLGLQEATRRFHRQLLCDTLESTEWNVAETAQRLEVTRSHVYNLIRAFGLKRQRPAR